MFLSLIDNFSLLGIICAGLVPVAVGVFLFFMTLLLTDKKWAMIILAVVWYLLLVYSVGGFAKHVIFVYVSSLYAVTVLSGVLIFSGIFRHRVLLYFLCCLSLFLHGFPLSLALKESSIYNLARCGFKNVEQIDEYGVNRMLVISDDKECLDMAYHIKQHIEQHAENPFQRGLVELCLKNHHEAAAFFKKAQDKDNSSFLKGVIKYCDGEYKEAALIFFEKDKEASALIDLLIATRDDETKKRAEKQFFKILAERYTSTSAVSANMDWNIRYIMFLSVIWGQIITIPMIVFRRSDE